MIWIGPKKPNLYFFENLHKWKGLMPNWEFKVWTNDTLTPELIDKEYLDLLNDALSGSHAADILRWYLLWKWGGYYVDADITPIKSLENINTHKYPVVLCHDLPITWNYIACGFVASEPGHKLFKTLVNKMYQADLTNTDIHLVTGPGALGEAWENLDWQNNGGYLMLPYWFFYRNRIGDPSIDSINRIMQNHLDAVGNHFYAAEWK